MCRRRISVTGRTVDISFHLEEVDPTKGEAATAKDQVSLRSPMNRHCETKDSVRRQVEGSAILVVAPRGRLVHI